MVLYNYFLLFNMIVSVFSKNLGIRSGMEDPLMNSVGLRLFTEISNNDDKDLTIELFPEECCLDSNDNKCNIIEIIGGVSEVISAGATKTIKLIAPILDQFNRKGYCVVYIDSSPILTPKDIIRDTVKIKFDTTLKIEPDNNAKLCDNIDEDPFNDCKPVNCDTYYNGKKSYYSKIKRRCISVPTCLPNHTKTPKAGYNPISNRCIDQDPINQEDMAIVRQMGKYNKSRNTKDLIIIEMGKGNNRNYTLSSIEDPVFDDFKVENVENKKGILKNKNKLVNNNEFNYKIKALKDDDEIVNKSNIDIHDTKMKNQLTTATNVVMSKPNIPSFNNFLTYLTNNRYAMIILSSIILMQCLIICTMVYCMSRNCGCCKKKPKVKKIFNYRQDASVTTPLIGTSNIDTETTDFQYLSESSNCIDRKIKCYKACQKERKNNMKLSMSDDILSKCINRRDWHRLPRSDTIPEARIDEENNKKVVNIIQNESMKPTEIKVNFEEEYMNEKNNVHKKESVSIKNHQTEASEREIRCHSYDYNSNLTGFKNSSTTYGAYNKKNKTGNSIEKGAQAYFSNDSIEDFLSERGVVFFGDDTSKYSLTSLSSATKSTTTSNRSSKTSKNNIVKNVMSLLTKKSKGPASDPGVKQCKADLNLELLHISTASVFTSSNDTETGKDIKTIKDSTSSL